jgi:hypothetical protein
LRQFPTETIAKSVVLNSIEEREITEYAAKAAARPLRIGRILWLLVVLWPIGLGWTNIFAYIGLAVSVAFLWLISDAFGCPCCGHFEPMESGKATHCARCGISGAKSAR